MPGDLSFDLHALTAKLDRSADRILQDGFGISYRRFRVLLIVGRLGAATQRAVAEELGISEPSASRMTGVLVGTGLLDALPDPVGGNRRRLSLTVEGKQIVDRCRTLLEQRFAALVERSGVSYADYARDTRKLLDAL
ncbi:MarR family transcriptional regulator [Actinomycetes bacterium KLBMP 9759]